jgi:predicted TIM-barrel fold metal-dependent hydrolase
MSTLTYLGPGKIVLGSDDPHQIGDIGKAVGRIKALKIPEKEKQMILEENSARLLKL